VDYKKLIKQFDTKKAARSNFDAMYQVIGEYISMNKQDFQGQPSNGQFLVDRIFDATGPFAATNSASSLLGMLWPGAAANTFEIAPVDEDTKEDDFFLRANKKIHAAFDDPKSNMAEALDEYMSDQIIFGTSGVGVENGDDTKLYFTAYGVKEIYPVCGKGGRIVGFHMLFEWDVERVVAEYGLSKCSPRVQKAHEGGKLDEKVQVLFCVYPSKGKKAEKGKYSMPLQGVHLDYKACHAMKEDGYYELPIAIGRFRKLNYEEMGRSPAMNALPDIREANALREAIIIATEKVLEMPKGVMSDGEFGGGFIDQSAGAINVFNAVGNIGGQAPVFDIGSPPNIPWAEKRLEKLEQSIGQHFMIDRLLDFNNDTQMTLGEAQIRDQMRTASMAALFNRQIQIITLVIERGVALLMRAGDLGVVRGSDEERALVLKGEEPYYIPDVIAKDLADGKDIYKIIYKTKAALAFSAEQYMAILEMFNIVAQNAQIEPSLVARVDYHAAIKRLAQTRGIDFMLKPDKRFDAEMEAKQEQAQATQALQAGQQVADIANTAAGAESQMMR